jgi:hypothetical protein
MTTSRDCTVDNWVAGFEVRGAEANSLRRITAWRVGLLPLRDGFETDMSVSARTASPQLKRW